MASRKPRPTPPAPLGARPTSKHRTRELQAAKESIHESLDASEQRYQQLYENAPVGYLTLDPSGRFEAANVAAATLFGKPAESLIGHRFSRFIFPEFQDAWHRYRRELLRGSATRSLVLDLEAARGSKRNVELAGMVLRTKQGDPIGLAVAILDLTERRSAERSARDLKRHMQIMTDALPELISYVDRSERYRFMSSAYEMWFHEPPELLRGRTVREVLGEEVYSVVHEHIRTALSGVQTRFEREMKYRDGTTRQVSATYTPDLDENGTVQGFFSVVRDLTALRRAEHSLRAAVAEVALAEERERRKLAADLHDDVSQLLALSSQRLRAAQEASNEFERVSFLTQIAVLLSEAREHVSSLSFQLSPSILYDVGFVAAARWLADDFARTYGLAVNLEVTRQGLDFLDEAMRVTLYRTLRELLINVVRHAQTKVARVEIGWDAGWASIKVEDDGVGFDLTAKRVGLGLVILTERVEHMGGSVRITSAPGRGTQAIVRIPALRSEPPSSEEESGPAPAPAAAPR